MALAHGQSYHRDPQVALLRNSRHALVEVIPMVRIWLLAKEAGLDMPFVVAGIVMIISTLIFGSCMIRRYHRSAAGATWPSARDHCWRVVVLPMLELHHSKAMASLPHEIYDYYVGGAGDEVSASEAESAWSAFRFRPRPLRDVGHIDTRVDLFGESYASPIGVAPMAFHHLAHPGAELETARGTKDAGSLFVVSTRASRRLEDIASRAGPWWFQAYVFRERSLTAKLVERAATAGATAIVLTGDTPVVGHKRRIGEVRMPIEDAYYLRNFAEHLAGNSSPRSASEQSPCTTLNDIGWLNSVSGLPVLVKGVLRGDAAVECLDAGAAGVIVSNHGGRQLDRAVSTARALQEVSDAVNGRGLVLADGGVRSGLDVLAALALGANAVFVGRPILWALAHSGGTGVYDALTALREDLEHVMALAGVRAVQDIDRSLVADDWHRDGEYGPLLRRNFAAPSGRP